MHRIELFHPHQWDNISLQQIYLGIVARKALHDQLRKPASYFFVQVAGITGSSVIVEVVAAWPGYAQWWYKRPSYEEWPWYKKTPGYERWPEYKQWALFFLKFIYIYIYIYILSMLLWSSFAFALLKCGMLTGNWAPVLFQIHLIFLIYLPCKFANL